MVVKIIKVVVNCECVEVMVIENVNFVKFVVISEVVV